MLGLMGTGAVGRSDRSQALTEAFENILTASSSVTISSVKTNIGHAAAGSNRFD